VEFEQTAIFSVRRFVTRVLNLFYLVKLFWMGEGNKIPRLILAPSNFGRFRDERIWFYKIL